MDDDKPKLTAAIAELLWDYLKKDPEHKDRRWIAGGTKTKLGLRKSIERVIEETTEDDEEDTLVVRVATDDRDEFYEISTDNAKKLLALPIPDRRDFFYEVAKEAFVSDDDANLYIDDSGNQTEEEFWKSEGEEEWQGAVGEEYIVTIKVTGQRPIKVEVYAISDFAAGELALAKFEKSDEYKKLKRHVNIDVAAVKKK